MERNGRKLRSLTDDELHDNVVDMVSEIKLITGALVYAGDMLHLQIEVIKKFLRLGFSMLTKEEIIHAFYMNSEGKFDEVYRHYNKELNAEFIGDVLREYLKFKARIVKEKSAQVAALLNPPNKEVQTVDYDFWRGLVQENYIMYRKGGKPWHIWHPRIYYTLRKFGLVPYKGLSGYMYFVRKLLENSSGGLNIPDGASVKHLHIRSVNELRGLFQSSNGYNLCIDYTRQLVVVYVFDILSYCGINNIWEDVMP